MISINLLPEEFRVQEKTTANLPLLKIAAVSGALFLLLTGFFYIDFLSASAKLKKTEKEWQRVEPESEKLKLLQQEVETVLQPERNFLSGFVTTEKPLTYFLAWTSEFLPKSAWLTEVQMTRRGEGGDFQVKGFALPSKEKSSIEEIETFLHHLKEKMPEADLSLTTTRQTVYKTEVTQFIANFEWKGTSV